MKMYEVVYRNGADVDAPIAEPKGEATEQDRPEFQVLCAADELAACLSRVLNIEYARALIEAQGNEQDAMESFQESRKSIIDDTWERIYGQLR